MVLSSGLSQSGFGEMVKVPGGAFLMGPDDHYPKQAPVHRVADDPFWIDNTPVTNKQFLAFVEATGHRQRPRRPEA